jgi:hypothetical protein
MEGNGGAMGRIFNGANGVFPFDTFGPAAYNKEEVLSGARNVSIDAFSAPA